MVTTKYLIQDKSNNLLTYDGTVLINSPSQVLDKANFIDNGFDGLTPVYTPKSKTQQTAITLSQDLGMDGKVYECTLDLSNIFSIDSGGIS